MRVQAEEGYRVWAAAYDKFPNPLLALEARVLAPQLGNLRGKRVADIACGTGRWANHAQHLGARVIGVDRCREMIDHCRAPAVIGDAAHLPLSDGMADVAICAFAFGYLDSPLAELHRITRPGGSLFVSDVHPDGLDRGWTHSFRNGTDVYEIEHRRYSLRDLLNAPGWRLVDLWEPRFGEPERDIFRRAGKEADSDEMTRTPAVFVAHWIRA